MSNEYLIKSCYPCESWCTSIDRNLDASICWHDKVIKLDQLCFDTPWSPSLLIEELNHNDARNFALFDFDSLIGISLARIIADELWILRIMLNPNYRGRGLAKKLLMHQLKAVKNQGIKKCLLEVQTTNESAINLYKICGFDIISVRKNYYELQNGARADAYVMQRT